MNKHFSLFKKPLLIFWIFISLALLFSCTAGANPLEGSAGSKEESAGFLLGLWHGFILLFSFIASLFSDNISVYEIHNNGGWYNLGFLLGVSCFFGGSGGGAAKKRDRCD